MTKTSGSRQCEVCKVIKPNENFQTKYYVKCRACYNKDRQILYYENHERELKNAKEYRENNRERIRKYDRNFKRKEIENMDDKYIIKLLKKNHPVEDITKDMIKRKREYITNLRKNRIGSIYVISDTNYIKIGFTINIKVRKIDLQSGNPNELEIIKLVGNMTEAKEKELHKKLQKNHSDLYVRGEWYDKKILEHYNKYIGD